MNIDKDLTELMGICWHEIREYLPWVTDNKIQRLKCKQWVPIISGVCYLPKNTQPSSDGNDYIKLLEFIQNHEQWNNFQYFIVNKYSEEWLKTILNPEKGSIAIHEFFCGDKK